MRAIPPLTLGKGVRGWGVPITKLKFAVASPLISFIRLDPEINPG